jgi:hypothetical protein
MAQVRKFSKKATPGRAPACGREWHAPGKRSGRGAYSTSTFDFKELAATDVVEVAINRNGLGHEVVIADAGDVIEDSLFLVLR